MKPLNQALRAIRRNAMYYRTELDGFGGGKPFFRFLGICSNVTNWLIKNVEDEEVRNRMRSRLGELIRKWERENHIDGTNGVFPVGGHDEYESGDLYGKPRRWELLGYLIRETMK